MTEEEIKNLANRLGFDVLKDGAVVQLSINDDSFEIRKTEGKILTHGGKAIDPDIIISMSKSAFSNIKNSDNPTESIKLEYERGNVIIEPKKSVIHLGLKGYKRLYDLFR